MQTQDHDVCQERQSFSCPFSSIIALISDFKETIWLTIRWQAGTCFSELPPLEAIQNQENKILHSTSYYETQFDTTPGTVPVVNPTNPGTTPVVTEPPPTPSGINPTNPGTTPVVTESPPPPSGITPPATTAPPSTTTPTTSGGSWCIASPSASETALQVALDYACGYGGADCSAIQSGASCYNPNTLRDHASYAFNDYYQKNPAPTSCVFGGAAQLTSTDPSNGNCHYPSPKPTSSLSPPTTPTITTSPSPPTTMTPTTTTPALSSPYGPSVYGVAEPTGEPSSAAAVSCSLLILFSTAVILGSLHV
ncbi:hypothetical protein K2173_006625 [Erythroxylum novogranatense]|uniref:X8 domain-containing protein n=1 Tax=Erythroxylum novogranatense TaxID=1862640 RepID=A0AAV8T750_9ROSI|nr:hypothetical protein K2173_006625 [Erythroxylum novogranatense]